MLFLVLISAVGAIRRRKCKDVFSPNYSYLRSVWVRVPVAYLVWCPFLLPINPFRSISNIAQHPKTGATNDMMANNSFREGQQRAANNQGNQVRHHNGEFGTVHGEPLYYQMSRMVPPPSSTTPFTSAPPSSNIFFTTPHNSQYTSAMNNSGHVKSEYSVNSDRAISDEMMRHLLLSANSVNSPPQSTQNTQSLPASQMRGPLQQAQPTSSFSSLAAVKEEKQPIAPPSTGKGKKGARAQKNLLPGEKPVRKKKRRAFEFYWEELRGEYAKTHAHMGHNERRAVAQAEWKNVENRDKWQKMADEYNAKMLDEKYKHRPKPPVTANAFFFKEQHLLLRQQRPDLKGGAVLSEISKMWERCTERTRWLEMQAADRRRYEAEMARYKEAQPGLM